MLARRYQSALAVAAATAAFAFARRRRVHSRRHRSQDEREWARAQTKIIILGGGFGGVAAALALDRQLRGRRDVSVLLIDRGNAQLFVPLLWTIADGRSSAEHVMVPIRSFQAGRAFHVMHADVEAIDLEARTVHTSAGARRFDRLIIALGSVTQIPHQVPGAREHALVFRSPADAMQLRNRIIDALEAAHRCADPAERRAWLTFVVIGGGETGTELAATINDYVRAGLQRDYPWLLDEPAEVVVVEGADRLVPLSSEAVSRRVRRSLERRGVSVRTGAAVERVEPAAVIAAGTAIPARTVYWSAGIAPPDLVRDLAGADHAKNGALLVDERLRLRGRRDAFAIGDNAWAIDALSGRPVPALAQAAEHEAAYVAAAIADDLAGREPRPFRFKTLGQMTLLGKYDAIAEVGTTVFTGPFAWLVWHAYYALRVGSWRTRVYLVTGWLMSLLFGRTTSEIPLYPSA